MKDAWEAALHELQFLFTQQPLPEVLIKPTYVFKKLRLELANYSQSTEYKLTACFYK